MKLSTLALCSTLGMALTSVSVWALTPEGSAKAWSASTSASVADPGADGPSLASILSATSAGAQFESGKLLTVAGRLGHAILPSTGGETFVFVDVKAATDRIANTTAPLNLSIVIDRSRSMEGQRMHNALEAARGMIRRLRVGDTVSVVTYNTQSEVLVPATTIDEESRGRVLFSLRDVEARGHTCISCGIEAGLDAMGQRRDAVARMLLLSDGEANAGIRDEQGFRALAERAYEKDVSISSVGVDVDYNERVMFTVAQASNGRHYFVEETSELPAIFDQEFSDLVKTIANDANLEIALAPGVQLLQVYDRTYRADGERIVVPLGSFAASDEKTLLMRVRVPGADAARREVASVRMTYDDLVDNARGECDGQLVAQLTADRDAVGELDPIVELRLSRSDTSSTLQIANEQFSRGDFAAAQRTIEDSRGRIRSRREAAKKKAPRPALERLDKEFDAQFSTLEEAEQGFSAAAQAAPNQPAESRAGKVQIRSNVDRSFDLGL